MESVFKLLETYEAAVYIFLGAIGILWLRKLLIAWRGWQEFTFGLEREMAGRRVSAALTIVVLLGILAVVEFLMVSFVLPALPAQEVVTPTVSLLVTPTVQRNPKQTAAPGAASTAVSPAAPVAAPAVNGCSPGKIEWTYPKKGDEISGTVELKGTIDIGNLGFYKYEFSQLNSDSWVTIAAGNTLKKNEPLGGAWNTSVIIPGDYLLRLVVTDNQNQPLPPCQISVRVVAQ